MSRLRSSIEGSEQVAIFLSCIAAQNVLIFNDFYTLSPINLYWNN
jgi:hypothetical protein